MQKLCQSGVFLHTFCIGVCRGQGSNQPGRAELAKLVQPVPGPDHSHSVAWAPPPQVALLAPGLPSVEGVKIVPSPILPELQVSTRLPFLTRSPYISGPGARGYHSG